MPLIKSWNCTFDYAYKFLWIDFGSNARIELANVNLIAAATMKATSSGHMYPQLHNFHLDFGDTEIYLHNKFK